MSYFEQAFGAIVVGMFHISVHGDTTEINLVDDSGVTVEGGTYQTEQLYQAIREFVDVNF